MIFRTFLLLSVIAVGLVSAALAVSPTIAHPHVSIPTPILFFVLALPHFLYATVWRSPGFWIRTLGPQKLQALNRFALFAAIWKPLQFVLFISWWSGMLLQAPKLDAIFYASAVAGFGLVIFGQVCFP
jgi:hypothetical protein